ncbi:hypothetical protein CLAFUW4_11591 [Fulvia fulva]|uniref:Uncharacterized protein n=1 Tax=Passalora fulva TaxID=5499 RepID=A0A9Q8PBX8_PASFU|nr:uncharacterized protein CLAFUR5_10636 [Fulvia fulva]KAK4620236.1 hypothetical protein CLAFUR4_11596 [Fulvia fulva]KAK4620941.1 hypothetical protein CLAFUR0_11605 [Fulvia fulva]UJO19605.1 hypothetical protein CLAFUR5_10636 [Fulvia fulva]WPV17601.1 hypothetical protein CLAFUW4_11591 [Fulvia fulva]WPV32042.1 hypothetical protein CLAFUW7_11595 [Fulvia fulva]
MKFSPAVLAALPLAAAAPQQAERVNGVRKRADLPYYLEFHYTGDFIKVGDADLFGAIWQKGYGSGDATGIETDDSYDVFGSKLRCVSDDKPDLQVGVKLKGDWGFVEEVPGIQVRNQLVKSMWEMVQKIQEEDDLVYKKCRGCGLGGCSDDPKALCGAFRDDMCDCNKNVGGGNEADFLCYDKSTTYKVPTEMTLTLYNRDGSLRADSLGVSITSAEIAQPALQCGKLGAATEVIIGIIPEFGKYIGDQLKIACRN